MNDTETEDWYSDDAATFGDRLSGARESVGLSQQDLAARIGVRLQTLQHWEDDLSDPRANKLAMLSGVLNASIPWLLTGSGEGPAAPGAPQPGEDAGALADEVAAMRREIKRLGNRLGALEARLRARA